MVGILQEQIHIFCPGVLAAKGHKVHNAVKLLLQQLTQEFLVEAVAHLIGDTANRGFLHIQGYSGNFVAQLDQLRYYMTTHSAGSANDQYAFAHNCTPLHAIYKVSPGRPPRRRR